MIDELQFPFTTHKQTTHLLTLPFWEIVVNEKTWERVDDVREAKFRKLNLKLKPSAKGGYHFLVDGSIHVYHNFGEHNADRFTFYNLWQAIGSITSVFALQPDKCFIHGIEIGVNIPLPYPPLRVLKNIISYRSHPFVLANKRNIRKGLNCKLSQYSVKIYDKAVQSEIDCGNILRFEVHIDKMKAIERYDIKTLSDLYDSSKVYSLINVLHEAYAGIIWTDTTVSLKKLTDKELKQWLYFTNPRTWHSASKHERSRGLKKWQQLLSKYASPCDLLNRINNEWEKLFCKEDKAENLLRSYHSTKTDKAVTKTTFLPLECSVKKSPFNKQQVCNRDTGFLSAKSPYSEMHKVGCKSCGRDIAMQKKGSIFCSEKHFGSPAKKCRNKDSNLRYRMKLKTNQPIKSQLAA